MDPHCPQYHEINESILRGIRQYTKIVPTVNRYVNRLIYHNLMVTYDSVMECAKPETTAFLGFHEYYHYLREHYAMVARTFTILREFVGGISTPLSLAVMTALQSTHWRKITVLTRFSASQNRRASERTPRTIWTLRRLTTEAISVRSLDLSAFDHRRAFERGFAEEYLFYSAMHDSQDANFLDIFGHIHGACLLLTGTLGEIWYPRAFIDSALARHGQRRTYARGPWMSRSVGSAFASGICPGTGALYCECESRTLFV